MFRHVVLFRVRDEVTGPEVLAAIEMLSKLGAAPGVAEWDIALSLDERKGRVLVEDGTFIDRPAFEAWRLGADHRVAAARMAEIADWLVADWSSVG